jgi:hypothetical protein
MGGCWSTAVQETQQADFPASVYFQPAERSFSKCRVNHYSFSLTPVIPNTSAITDPCNVGCIPGQNSPCTAFEEPCPTSSPPTPMNVLTHADAEAVLTTNVTQQVTDIHPSPSIATTPPATLKQTRSRSASDSSDDETARSLRNYAVERRLEALSMTSVISRSTSPDKKWISQSGDETTMFQNSLHKHSYSNSPFTNQDVLDDINHIVHTPPGRRTALAFMKTCINASPPPSNNPSSSPSNTADSYQTPEQPLHFERKFAAAVNHATCVQPAARYARKRSNGIDPTQHAPWIALAQQRNKMEEELIETPRAHKHASMFLLRMHQIKYHA